MIYQLPGYERMLREYPNITFVFEYISLKDTHVVKYTKEQEGLYLIGMRSNLTGEEYSYESILKFANYTIFQQQKSSTRPWMML